jgi:parvulin-like peptidyl-prolyl isomerase
MKRLVIALWCIAAAGLFFPGMVFSGGKGDKGASGSKGSQQGQGSTPGKTTETSLQDPEVATIQIAPGIAKETIFRGQLKAEIERMEKSAGRPLSADEQRQVLDVMINERLAVQAAERDKVAISDNEVNQQVQQLRTAMVQGIGRQPTDAEFAQAVKNETGLELQAFRDQLRRQLTVQRYLQTKKQPLFDSIKIPTEAEILEAFNTAKADFVRPPTIRFSMIQVPFGADAAARTKSKDLADRLVREIGSDPSKFDDAVARGQSPNAGYQAGEVGYLPKTLEAQQRLGQDFINTAFALKQGQVSKLIEGPQAYNIIKVTESYAQKNLELDDIFRLGTRMTVRDYIGNVILQRRQQEIIAQASQELIVELRAGGKTFQVFDKNLTL